jgi:hypothetical protein
MQAERTWSESFIWHIRQIPFQLAHMRDLAQTTVGAQAVGAGKITGSKERTALPYRVDPADDADLLYLRLIKFGRQVAETIGGSSPRPLRDRVKEADGDPIGLPSCTPSEAFSYATEIIQWLEACTHQIAHHGTLTQEGGYYDELIKTIRDTRRAYPRSEPKFRSYKPRLCPCQTAIGSTTRTIYVTAAPGELTALCEACGSTWTR